MATFGPIEVGGIVDIDDHDPIIGEQLLFDRLAESKPVEHDSKLAAIVHRSNLVVRFSSSTDSSAREVTRCSGHKEPSCGLDLVLVKDRPEIGFDGPGNPVSLISYHQIEGWHLRQLERLRDLAG